MLTKNFIAINKCTNKRIQIKFYDTYYKTQFVIREAWE